MFQEFFFSHFTLLATNFEQLREKIEESLWCNRQSQPDMIAKAYNVFVEDIIAFYCAQKIKVQRTCTCIALFNPSPEVSNLQCSCYKVVTNLSQP